MNLLTDPLIRVTTETGLESMNLPELMAALGRDVVNGFPGIQRHQEDAFHVFLCYLAGAALVRSDLSEPLQAEAFWRKSLAALAGGASDKAWSLLEEDLAQPAFMQPPLPEKDHARLKSQAKTPDLLDLLPTAKNHDLKQSRAYKPHTDEWIYALVSLQTMSGFYGRGNPGISRMNSGFGSRLIVELVGSHRPGARWRDAVVRLLDHHEHVLSEAYGYDENGLVLVWTEPWDGETSLPVSRLDPFYIEICRRIRLRGKGSVARADGLPSISNRIAAKELNGVVGDAWLPIDLGTTSAKGGAEKALTVSPQGLTAGILRRIVFGDGLKLTRLQEPLERWREQLWIEISVLVRGQGTTDGFHEKSIPLPPKIQRKLFGPPEKRQPLLDLSRSALEVTGIMRDRVLKRAIFTYLQGAPERIQFDRDSAQAWWRRYASWFETLWSEHFFPWLWSAPAEFDIDDALDDWLGRLIEYGRIVLDRAVTSLPARTGQRYRSRVLADRAYWSALYYNFPQLKEERHERTADA